MRIAVVSRDPDDQEELEYKAKKRGFKIHKKPEVVLSCGGDGTLLIAERMHPGAPKLMIKDSDTSKIHLGYETPSDELLDKLKRGAYSVKEFPKLQAQWYRKGKLRGDFTCTNEFNVRNQLLIQALRFKVTINDEELFDEELIGDGVVICTPFGSTGYYESITKQNFKEGIGIGLNNCTIKQRGIHTSHDKTIKIQVTRMPADFAIDNDPQIRTLEPEDELIINASAEKMRIIEF